LANTLLESMLAQAMRYEAANNIVQHYWHHDHNHKLDVHDGNDHGNTQLTKQKIISWL
jgi:hypothetical protein